MPSSAMIVPACPTGVVFLKEDFLNDEFEIDSFLGRYAGNFGLETLRDDLGMYLQVRMNPGNLDPQIVGFGQISQSQYPGILA